MGSKMKSFFILWLIILIVNQAFLFHGCFSPYCIIAALPHTGIITFLVYIYAIREDKTIIHEEKKKIEPLTDEELELFMKRLGLTPEPQSPDTKTIDIQSIPPQDHLKEKGDRYERFIGKQFEDKGEIVIYNGFIQGYEDDGVDVASISTENKTINLIQCKNWTNRALTLQDIQTIYDKLQAHRFDFLVLSATSIQNFQNKKTDISKIRQTLLETKQNLQEYTIRKTLYISSEKVVNLEIGKFLTMIKPNIFRYEDMKIVVVKIQ